MNGRHQPPRDPGLQHALDSQPPDQRPVVITLQSFLGGSAHFSSAATAYFSSTADNPSRVRASKTATKARETVGEHDHDAVREEHHRFCVHDLPVLGPTHQSAHHDSPRSLLTAGSRPASRFALSLFKVKTRGGELALQDGAPATQRVDHRFPMCRDGARPPRPWGLVPTRVENRYQPLTAPAASPDCRKRCRNRNSATSGITPSTEASMTAPLSGAK